MGKILDVGDKTHLWLERVFMIFARGSDDRIPEFPFVAGELGTEVWAAAIVESEEVFQEFLKHRHIDNQNRLYLRQVKAELLPKLVQSLKERDKVNCRIVFINQEGQICSGPTDTMFVEEKT